MIVILVIGFACIIALFSLIFFQRDTTIIDLGYRHFASIFGLPAAAAAALAIVLLTRVISGPMSVEVLGLKFQGAASETICGLLVFLLLPMLLV
jgi:hypothetical protein